MHISDRQAGRWGVRPGGLLWEHKEARTAVPRSEPWSVLNVRLRRGKGVWCLPSPGNLVRPLQTSWDLALLAYACLVTVQ